MNTTTSQLSFRTVADEKDSVRFPLKLVETSREDPASCFAPGAHSDVEAVLKKKNPSKHLLPLLALLTASLVSCDKKDPDPGGPGSEPNPDQFKITYPTAKSTKGGKHPLYHRHGFHQIGAIQSESSPALYSLQRDPK